MRRLENLFSKAEALKKANFRGSEKGFSYFTMEPKGSWNNPDNKTLMAREYSCDLCQHLKLPHLNKVFLLLGLVRFIFRRYGKQEYSLTINTYQTLVVDSVGKFK